MTRIPITILLVEADEAEVIVTRQLLPDDKQDEFALEWVAGYEPGLKRILDKAHDIYLVGYSLGDRTGLELLEEALHQGCKAPMILLTREGDRDVDTAAMKLGAADYLVKEHLNAPLLERSMHHALERYRTLDALQQALQEKSLMSTAIANLTIGVIITDPNQADNPVVFVNPAFTAITGYTEAETLHRNCRFLQGPETNPTTVEAIRTAIAQHQGIHCTILNYRKDGTPFWNELIINPVCDASGNLTHYIGLQSDVTARKHAEQTLETLRHQNELILNSVGEGIYGIDLEGNATFVNPAAARMLGWDVNDLIGQPIDAIIHPKPTDGSSQAQAKRVYSDFLDGQMHRFSDEFCRKDGTYFPVEYISTPIREHTQLVGAVITFQDITERKRSEEALRDSEERYALAVRGANDGIWDWNLKTGEVYFSPRWKAMLGYEDAEVAHSLEEWFDRVHPDDLYWVKRELTAHLEGLTPHFEHEHRMRHRNNTYRWMLSRGLAVRDSEGKATRVAGSQTDITGRRHVEEQLLHDAFHDALTGLPNRALLMDRLRHAVEVAKRNANYLYAVLFLDIDRFKVINDSLGHMVGDCLLVAIAHRLTLCIRPGDTIARLGGDEFVILLENIRDINSATAVADRIQRELAVPITLNNQEVFTTASIGIAIGTGDYEQGEDLLRDADTAMYRAKAQGRARYEIFNTGMHLRAVALLQIENDLRRAIERQEFQLHYQPIVSLRDLRVIGFEALLRWYHPERGMISPAEFIPVAEDAGLIVSIGHWVMREACQQMQTWHQHLQTPQPLTINVNLSGKHFTPKLIDELSQTLKETGLNPSQLKLEITESVLMENAESAVTILTELRDLGVQLSIDDFGTGYSSLSYLHRFPIDSIKIDRSFVNKLDFDGEQLAIVRTIMVLAWNLGIDVVAEGVESTKQLAQLKSLQCDYAQGFYFSKPLGVEEATSLLSHEPPWQASPVTLPLTPESEVERTPTNDEPAQEQRTSA